MGSWNRPPGETPPQGGGPPEGPIYNLAELEAPGPGPGPGGSDECQKFATKRRALTFLYALVKLAPKIRRFATGN